MTLTLKALQRFVKIRRKSCFNSNLQFGADADECGFTIADLGEVEKFSIDGFTGYQWKPKIGDHHVRVIEFGRWIYLEGENFPEAKTMFEMMERATPIPLDK